jgi:DNA invertase Pin-like site-specific DNA recombinase
MIGAFAEFERAMISERTKEGLKHSKNKHKIGKRGKDKKPRKKRGVLKKPLLYLNEGAA